MRVLSVEDVMKNLAGKSKLALVDVNSITKKMVPVQPSGVGQFVSHPQVSLLKHPLPAAMPQSADPMDITSANKLPSVDKLKADAASKKASSKSKGEDRALCKAAVYTALF